MDLFGVTGGWEAGENEMERGRGNSRGTCREVEFDELDERWSLIRF